MVGLVNPRVVLVHDWLTGMRGGEKCLEAACELWPSAKLFTLIHSAGSVNPAIEKLKPSATLLNRMPGVRHYYRYLLPIMPWFAKWPIPDCDVVLSLSHCIAKAAIAPPHTPHICYCFTPMRYAWQLREAYLRSAPGNKLSSQLQSKLLDYVREWDRKTAAGVSHFVAISQTIAQRIRECYGRESVVIYPPVDTDFYTSAPKNRENYYLIISAMAPYKRIDLAIKACNQLNRRLVIIGTGQQEGYLRSLAGPTTTFLGWQDNEMIRQHLQDCRALLFPGEEDFGIVPLEAQACGTPVIAYGKGGVCETVLPIDQCEFPTGVFFEEQSVDRLIEAMLRFEREYSVFEPAVLRQNALRFSKQRFLHELSGYVQSVIEHPQPVLNSIHKTNRAA